MMLLVMWRCYCYVICYMHHHAASQSLYMTLQSYLVRWHSDCVHIADVMGLHTHNIPAASDMQPCPDQLSARTAMSDSCHNAYLAFQHFCNASVMSLDVPSAANCAACEWGRPVHPIQASPSLCTKLCVAWIHGTCSFRSIHAVSY